MELNWDIQNIKALILENVNVNINIITKLCFSHTVILMFEYTTKNSSRTKRK